MCAFEAAGPHERFTEETRKQCGELEPCISCASKFMSANKDSPILTVRHEEEDVTMFIAGSHEYHTYDFVYLVNCHDVKGIMEPLDDADINPYNIGQIVDIRPGARKSTVKVVVRLLERYDNYLEQNPPINGRGNRIQKPVFKDCRRLVLTDTLQTFSSSALEGTCRVKFTTDNSYSKALADYKSQPNMYYYKDYLPPSSKSTGLLSALKGKVTKDDIVRIQDDMEIRPKPVIQCMICADRREEQEKRQSDFLITGTKLRALDIFAGCGGLSTGLKSSGVVETKYAIEFFTSAAQTFKYVIMPLSPMSSLACPFQP
jgi:hypothetical protein